MLSHGHFKIEQQLSHGWSLVLFLEAQKKDMVVTSVCFFSQ